MAGVAEFEDQLNHILSDPGAMSQIMQLAQSLTGGGNEDSAGTPAAASPAPSTEAQNGMRSPPAPPSSPSSASLLSSLSGGLDPQMIGRLLPLIQELGSSQNSNARQLIYALRPYLKEERQEKVERALQLARLFHIGKKFLSGWEA